MAIKSFKPTTPSLRGLRTVDYSHLSKEQPLKSQTVGLRKTGGRNNHGHITAFGRGGGHKRLYRIIDFVRTQKLNVPGVVHGIEYDPNRTAFIARIHYVDGDKRYILAPDGLVKGDQVVCAEKAKIKAGNRMMLKHIPVGQILHSVELILGNPHHAVRSAGAAATLVSLEGPYAQVKLPSGEVRYVSKEAYATIGQVSNIDHSLETLGKAGRQAWLGRRPHVGGSQKNPVDHPHGGGEGHQSIGLRGGPKTPWGKKALGVKTRTNKRTNRFVAKSRRAR